MKKIIFTLTASVIAAFVFVTASPESRKQIMIQLTLTEVKATTNEVSELPKKMFGVTIDNVRDEGEIIKQLKRFKAESKDGSLPVVRIVFDVDDSGNPLKVAQKYKAAIQKIKGQNDKEKLAFVMASVFDSQAVHACRNQPVSLADCYEQRTRNFYEELKDEKGEDLVDLWEIGNEVNGEWVGWIEDEKTKKKEWHDDKITVKDMLTRRDDVAEAVAKAYRFIESKGKQTVLTLYLNQDTKGNSSWESKKKRIDSNNRKKTTYGESFGMLTWWDKYKVKFPAVDYIFISYWQDDNFEVLPAEWKNIFEHIGNDVKSAKLGFGEVGAQCYYKPDDSGECQSNSERPICQAKQDGKKVIDYRQRRCACCLNAQKTYIDRYYSLWNSEIRKIISPELNENFVGGYFYWQFNEDVLNKFTNAANTKTKQTERDALNTEAENTLKFLLTAYDEQQSEIGFVKP